MSSRPIYVLDYAMAKHFSVMEMMYNGDEWYRKENAQSVILAIVLVLKLLK